jgi:hypothetical protein
MGCSTFNGFLAIFGVFTSAKLFERFFLRAAAAVLHFFEWCCLPLLDAEGQTILTRRSGEL